VTDRLTMRVALRLALVTIFGVATASAQFQMPDPKEMSGIPRGRDLPVARCRCVIRGDLSKNIANQEVELTITASRAREDRENGRAEFGGLPKWHGQSCHNGGRRAAGIAGVSRTRTGRHSTDAGGDRQGKAQSARDAAAPAVTGNVILGGETRIVIEPDDDSCGSTTCSTFRTRPARR
jgi:hypothetical protein